jgi:glycosyltransferase involved in cell wall biosynthesis
MALLEAMSYGLAVVSFDCPYGPRAIIDNHQNGILVENGNTAELANTIIKLIKDRKQQECLANSAYEKAHLYDIRVIGKRWEQLFDELITNH